MYLSGETVFVKCVSQPAFFQVSQSIPEGAINASTVCVECLFLKLFFEDFGHRVKHLLRLNRRACVTVFFIPKTQTRRSKNSILFHKKKWNVLAYHARSGIWPMPRKPARLRFGVFVFSGDSPRATIQR